jgi:hypothetical protein
MVNTSPYFGGCGFSSWLTLTPYVASFILCGRMLGWYLGIVCDHCQILCRSSSCTYWSYHFMVWDLCWWECCIPRTRDHIQVICTWTWDLIQVICTWTWDLIQVIHTWTWNLIQVIHTPAYLSEDPDCKYWLLWQFLYKCSLVHEGSVRIKTKLYSMAWFHEQTIPTEWPLLVGEVSVKFCR